MKEKKINNNSLLPNVDDPKIIDFYQQVLDILPYEPNQEQVEAFAAFAYFLLYGEARSVFMLNGYAGTGKTSLMGAVVKALSCRGVKVVLLAPTGRAAQVFSEYSQRMALTIHRKIYRQQSYLSEGFALAENKHSNTIFIVDEASMIANDSIEGSIFGTGRLLDDLVHYVYNGQGCKLMLMGDDAQLPPVGQLESPALSEQVMKNYGLNVYSVHLSQIARQAADSGILINATILRNIINSGNLVAPNLNISQYPDVEAITGEFLLETLSDCYDRDGIDETIVITRSNKRATLFNNGVRNTILYREDLLTTGDMLLVAKNNYFWSQEYDGIDFIANGDMMRVKRVWGDVEKAYGLRFANVTVELPDHDNIEMDVKIIIDSLLSDTPALTLSQSQQLYAQVLDECTGNKRERYKQMKEHHYFNALQVKFAYAVTCHKSQGGQWKNVFVDMGSIMPDALSTIDFLRWLYTAITRSSSKVYLINCPLKVE